MKTRRWPACVVPLAAVVVLACGGDHVDLHDTLDRTPPLRGEWAIEEARQFDDFALYWVREEFNGIPLTGIARFDTRAGDRPAEHPENGIHLTYGTCDVDSGPFEDGSCSPPIQIVTEGPGEKYCTIASNFLDRSPFRGGAETGRAEIESAVYVWTSDVVIKIYAYGESGGPMAVANALTALNADVVQTSSDPLPAVSADC